MLGWRRTCSGVPVRIRRFPVLNCFSSRRRLCENDDVPAVEVFESVSFVDHDKLPLELGEELAVADDDIERRNDDRHLLLGA